MESFLFVSLRRKRYKDIMAKDELIQLFGEQKVRTKWDGEKQKWYFSIVDVCGVLTDSKDYLTARKYWNKLKQRLKEEGNETVTNCHQLKMMPLPSAISFSARSILAKNSSFVIKVGSSLACFITSFF